MSGNDADRFQRAPFAAGQMCCGLGFFCRFRSSSEKLSEGMEALVLWTPSSSLLARWIGSENPSTWGRSDDPKVIYSITPVTDLTAHTFFTSQDPLVRVIVQAPLFSKPLFLMPVTLHTSCFLCFCLQTYFSSFPKCRYLLPFLPRAGNGFIASALTNVSLSSLLPALKVQERLNEWFPFFSSSHFFSFHTKGCICACFSSFLPKTIVLS